MNLVLRLIPAFLLALLLRSSSGVAHADVFGIVTQARNATVSNGVVSAGASSTTAIRSQPMLMAR
jgi:hypothetical protein